jgi:transposase
LKAISTLFNKIKKQIVPENSIKSICYNVEEVEEIIKENDHLRDENKNLADENKNLADENKNLADELEKVRSEYKELANRLNMNSKNSSKPPSTDGYKKKPPKNSRVNSGKSTGGQLGHEGKTLEKIENPDERIEYKVPNVCNCGYNLEDVESKKKTRQIFDIVKIRKWITEHITNEKVCPKCGKIHETEFPEEVSQPTQYGEIMKSFMNYFTQYQLLPLSRTVEAISAITEYKVSEGTLVNASENLYKQLEDVSLKIKEKIIASDVVHFDETGMQSEGKLNWMHVASTKTLTHYEMHEKRGNEAVESIDILPKFKGTAVHDHWKPYYHYGQCTHSECNSHHLRYLQDVNENYKQNWAKDMIGLLIESHRDVETLKSEGFQEMTQESIRSWYARYHAIIVKGIAEDSEKIPVKFNKKGKPIKSKPLQLLLRMQKYDIETLAFIFDFNIPFDNNLAERDIRMQKLRQKISGCFRGKNGAQVFCRIRGYISTARKNGVKAIEAIIMAVKGQPFIPDS